MAPPSTGQARVPLVFPMDTLPAAPPASFVQGSVPVGWQPSQSPLRSPPGGDAGGRAGGSQGPARGGPGAPCGPSQPGPPHQRREAEVLKVLALPSASQFRAWKLALRDEVAGASGVPDEAFAWAMCVERPETTFDSLGESGAFASLDAKLAAALSKILQGELARQVNIRKEKMASTGRLMKGRQILWLLYQHFKISQAEGSLLEFQDLLNVKLQGDGLRTFLNDWDSVLLAMAQEPPVEILETLFRLQIQRYQPLRDQLAYYDRLDHGHADRSYAFLISAARRHLEQRRRAETREALSRGGSAYALPVSLARGDPGGKAKAKSKGKGICRSWASTGSCIRGGELSVSPLPRGPRPKSLSRPVHFACA